MAIRVVELHHHALRPGATAAVSDRLRDFYRDVLGLAGLDLGQGIDAAEPHLTLAVADLDAARHELDRLGVIYRTHTPAGAPARISLRDPAGNLLELHQWGTGRAAQRQDAVPIDRGDYQRIWSAVMFADMRGFTRISEYLQPDQVVPLLNEYFELLTRITLAHGGRVFHMAGDGMMAGFGVPDRRDEAPCQAVRAAREMLTRFGELAKEWHRRLGVRTGLGIGINAGEVIAGHVGSPSYRHYTIVGDVVNVASRLSQRARAGEALLSQSVMTVIRQHNIDLRVVELPALQLRGREAAVEIFCLPATERAPF
jgi:class 3 adenylate cyclase